MTQYTELRNQIKEALNKLSIPDSLIYYRKDKVPNDFPAAMILVEGDRGENPMKHGYNDLKLQIAVCLIIKIDNVDDPDLEIMTLKEEFRDEYKKLVGKDAEECEYYDARADSRKVRIAKIKIEHTL